MSFQLFVGGIGGPELVIVLVLVILLFGADKLPRLARASGEAMGEFQKGRERIETEIRDAAGTSTAAAVEADVAKDANVETDAAIDAAVDPDLQVETDHDAPSA
jgi:sec-independent protein translocase protein TatA